MGSKRRSEPPARLWKFPEAIRRWMLDPDRNGDHCIDGSTLYCAVSFGSVAVDPRHPLRTCRLCHGPVGGDDPNHGHGQ